MVIINHLKTGRTWSFEIDRKAIFEMASVYSVKLADKLPSSPNKENLEMMEDDRGLFNSYYSIATSDVLVMLARHFNEEFTDYNIDGDITYLTLLIPDPIKDSMAYVVDKYLEQYFIYRCLREWFEIESQSLGIDAKIAEIASNIRSALRQRSTAAKLPVNPIF